MRLIIASLVYLLISQRGPAIAADPPPVVLHGLSVTYPVADADKEIGGHTQGLSLRLLVAAPRRQIIGVDAQKSKLHRLVDDKDNVLVGDRGTPGISPFVTTSKAKDKALMHIMGGKAPASSARFIRVKADIVLKCGNGEQRASLKDFPLKVGQSAVVGPATVKVIQHNGAPALSVHYVDNMVTSLKVVDQKGTPLPQRASSASGAGGGKTQHTAVHPLLPGMEKATIDIVAFEQIELLTIPIDMEVGLGGQTNPNP